LFWPLEWRLDYWRIIINSKYHAKLPNPPNDSDDESSSSESSSESSSDSDEDKATKPDTREPKEQCTPPPPPPNDDDGKAEAPASSDNVPPSSPITFTPKPDPPIAIAGERKLEVGFQVDSQIMPLEELGLLEFREDGGIHTQANTSMTVDPGSDIATDDFLPSSSALQGHDDNQGTEFSDSGRVIPETPAQPSPPTNAAHWIGPQIG
jgi:hypothetical protein